MTLKKYTQLASILIIIATVYYSFYTLTPSKNYIATNKTEFSTEKALVHLKAITKQPHYTGSSEHTIARNYIANELENLGLEVEIQEQVAVNKKWRAATKTQNILARIKGSGNGKAILLLSHYDSNPHSSLGASDAASGVVAILEGIRAFLAKNEIPKNDIIICISDAEELGLLGANAFVNYHPWAKDVALVLNFEARGSGGPSYLLLETNGGNKNLIEAFQKANSKHPVGNSLMYSIYKMLPNDTDLTVFREEGNIDGFNFAFIGDHFDYHTEQDSYERMDLNSFNHQASYLIAGLSYFANSDLNYLKAQDDYVYFDFPQFGLIFYPFSWIIPMLLICLAIFFLLLIVGFYKNKLTLKGVINGFFPFILALFSSGLIAFFGWKIMLKIHPQYNDILQGFTYNGYYYIAFFVALTLAICFWFYKKYFKNNTSQDLLITPLVFWILVNVGVVLYLKGAAFFIFPVIVLLIILTVLIFLKSKESYLLYFTLLAVPILLIFSPFIQMFPVGLGLKMLAISSVFTVLLFGLLVPVFYEYKNNRNFTNLFILIAAMAIISAMLQANYSTDRKQPNSVLYMFDIDKNEAYWTTYNLEIDAFTKQFLGENPSKGNFDSITTASKYNTKITFHKKTEVMDFQKPTISIISDTSYTNERKIHLKILSNRNADKIELLTKNPIQFKSFKINEEPLKEDSNSKYVFEIENGTIMSYFRTDESEPIDIEFVVDKEQILNFDVLEIKFDLFSNPQFKIEPRSEIMMPMPFVLNDATILKTNIKL